VRAAALAALGALGGPEAEERLVAALTDAEAGVRRVAATAIGRLQVWRRAPSLVPLLDDADWDVRMAAADALRHLGAPGLIVLRDRARASTSAGDLAQHALDLVALEQGSP
jgi:HEAT repeat protein